MNSASASDVGLLGKGKTGGQALALLRERGQSVSVFDSTHPPLPENLKGLSALLIFVPGPVFLSYLPMLLDSQVPLVCGATGFTWPEGICDSLKRKKTPWIHAHNFSLGMVAVKAALEALARAQNLMPDARACIHEIHHTKKLDAPSGTALSWRSWLGPGFESTPITSAREGDVVGMHQFCLETDSEKIQLTHHAHDRRLFAQGAVWAMDQILAKQVPPGLNRFEELAAKALFEGKK